MRLFVAVDVPSELRRAASAAIEPLRAALAQAQWVPVENWHVTVKFLGETTANVAQETTARLGALAEGVVAFPTRLSAVGAFPTPAAARVLWAGLDDRAGRLAELARAVDAALSPFFAPASRPLTPHLTLARIKPATRVPSSLAGVAVPGDPFTVQEIVLYRSHPGRPAPHYEALARIPLRG
jgi:2'-5' RNA ligase